MRWGTPYPTSSPTSQTKLLLPELRCTCFLFEKGNALWMKRAFRHQINAKTLEMFNLPYGTWKKPNLEVPGDEVRWQQHPPANQSLPLHWRQWQMLRGLLFHPAAFLVLYYAKTHRCEKNKNESKHHHPHAPPNPWIFGFGPASEAPLPFHQAWKKRAFKMNFQSIPQ